MDSEGYIKGTKTGTLDFYNVFPRVEEVDDVKIKLDPGYYMSPFIRALTF